MHVKSCMYLVQWANTGIIFISNILEIIQLHNLSFVFQAVTMLGDKIVDMELTDSNFSEILRLFFIARNDDEETEVREISVIFNGMIKLNIYSY